MRRAVVCFKKCSFSDLSEKDELDTNKFESIVAL